MIGIFKREKDNLYAAIYSRDGLKSGIEGYVYDLNDSFKGEHHKKLVSDFNIPITLDDPNLEIILVDLKEKATTLKYEKRVFKINLLLKMYSNKKESNKEIEIVEKNGFLYFLGNRIELSKFSFYNKKTSIAIIDGIKVDIDIPLEVIEYLKNEKLDF